MARTTRISSEELASARQLREQCTSAAELRKALSVLLIAELGLDAEAAADILGISERTIFRNRGSFRNQGSASRNTWGGRRRCCLTIEEEREFLAQWESAAISGGVLTVPPLHAALVKRLGRDIPMSTTYRLLARHGWRKVQPDTKHPQSDPVAQEEFKKNSPKLWKPPA
jgi:transposase